MGSWGGVTLDIASLGVGRLALGMVGFDCLELVWVYGDSLEGDMF